MDRGFFVMALDGQALVNDQELCKGEAIQLDTSKLKLMKLSFECTNTEASLLIISVPV